MSQIGGTLTGRSVLITGGGTGVGADLARGFAGQGAAVVIAGRRAEPLEAVAQGAQNIRALQADVTQEADIQALFQAAGPVDIVIANAGAASSAPLTRTSLQDWNVMLAVNLTGVFLTLRQGLAQMTGWISFTSASAVSLTCMILNRKVRLHDPAGLRQRWHNGNGHWTAKMAAPPLRQSEKPQQ